MMSTTERQGDLLRFIRAYIAEHGIAPTTDEMREGMNLTSKSGIVRMLNGLEARRLIRRMPHRTRAIEVIAPPEPRAGFDGAAQAIVDMVLSRVQLSNFVSNTVRAEMVRDARKLLP